MAHRIITTIALSLALGACAAQPDRVATSPVSLEATVREAHAEQRVDTPSRTRSLITFDTAWPVRRVDSQSFVDGFQQTVDLGRPVPGLGINAIDIRLHRKTDGAAIERIAMAPPSEAMIRSELSAQFPRMEMRVIEQPRRNRLGIYGLAVGHWSNGARCIYAWQWIDDVAARGVHPEYDAAAIRIRLCGNGTTLDALAQPIDGIQFDQAAFMPAANAFVAANSTDDREAQRARRPKRHAVVRPRLAAPPSVVSQPVQPVAAPSAFARPVTIAASHQTTDLPLAALRGPAAATSRNSR